LFVHKFRNSKERQLSETLNRQGIHPLANLLVNIELAVSKSPLLEVIAKDWRGTVDAMTEMFLSMDRQLLNTMIEGRVIEQFQRNGKNNTREVLQRIEYKNFNEIFSGYYRIQNIRDFLGECLLHKFNILSTALIG
jgi:hypothetical protein